MSGYCLKTRDHNRSAAAWQMFMGWRVIMTSTGASGAVTDSCPAEPRWRETTTPSSQTAVHKGSQCSEWKLGYPSVAGFSVKVTEWQPLAATRRISVAANSGA